MIENIIIKHILGKSLNEDEKKKLDLSFRNDPSLIKEYLFIKGLLNFNFCEKNFDSILFIKNEKKIFSTIELQKSYFSEIKAATSLDNSIVISTSLVWNNLYIEIMNEFFEKKIKIKSLVDQNEVLFKSATQELFHIILNKGKFFTYSFTHPNVVLQNKDNSLYLFFR